MSAKNDIKCQIYCLFGQGEWGDQRADEFPMLRKYNKIHD